MDSSQVGNADVKILFRKILFLSHNCFFLQFYFCKFKFDCLYGFFIVVDIRYVDTNTPNLGEIYKTFDNILREIKKIICDRDRRIYE